jgi:MoxR-like ATPase
VASPALVKAVNLAIFLRRPLLVEGEAGCGKTRLARAVAFELGLPYYPWWVRSTSRAQDGLYTYDAILRLQDVHVPPAPSPAAAASTPNAGAGGKGVTPARNPEHPKDYRKLGALGKSFELRECPAVVLIDEIDKASLDFPNDLLSVLDEPWSFHIPETGEDIVASSDCRPIVIITSNKEKGNLPAPFLRRCVYFYLPFPDTVDRLKEIVATHYRDRQDQAPSNELLSAAATGFLEIRARDDLHKKPSTSEFLDWIEALRGFESSPYTATRLKNELKESPPFPELLLKLRSDLARFTKAS